MKSKIVTFGIIILLLFTLVILFFSTLKKPKYQFAYNADTLMTRIIQSDNQVTDFKADNSVLIDVRSKNQYIKGHLLNAINIYKANILDTDNYELFLDFQTNNKQVILYGKDIVEANMPFMILKQTGINNIKLLSKEGYMFFKKKKQDSLTDQTIDFVAFIANENNIAKEKQKEVKTIIEKVSPSRIPKTKKIVKIKKRETEEEEEEGC